MKKADVIVENVQKAGRLRRNLLSRIWTEEEQARLPLNSVSWWQEHRLDLLFLLFMAALLFGLSWILPFNQGPDEEMRYMIPQYIYRHGTLPNGFDPEIRHRIWGFSYAFHPILPYIFAGYLMKLVALFNSSEKALLMAARSISILAGLGFYWYVLQISRRLFSRRMFRLYFVSLLALLPQLLYLFLYVNSDCVAMLASAMIIYYWLEGLQYHWDYRSCKGLAISLAVCALSYYNAYGYGILSVILFIGSLIITERKKGIRKCLCRILQKGIYILLVVSLLAGWWFVRNAVLYKGDVLGFRSVEESGELYAMEEYKPSNQISVQEQGISLKEMLKNSEEGGMEWLRTTWRSFIGYFGFFEHALGIDIYYIHQRLFLLGAVGMLLEYLLLFVKRIRKKTVQRSLFCSIQEYFLLQFSFCCGIIIPVVLSLYNSYTGDFQPQGRYIMPIVIPLMYFAARGTERFLSLFFRKWFLYFLMLSLLYAVVHVFLGAFVSVYIPTYCTALSSWSQIRFPWFSNIGLLMKLISCLIPG